MNDRTGRRAAHAALAVVVTGTLAWFVARTPLGAGFPLDDAWIHQVVARRFATEGTLGFTPGRFGSGATSTLWPLLLALNPFALHVAPSTFAAVVAAALYFAAAHGVLEAALADGLGTARAFAFAALFALSPNHAWFVFSGMEATLFEALSVLAILAWRSRRRAALSGALVALAYLARPEAALLAGFLAVLRPEARSRRELVPLLTPVSAAVAVQSLLLLRASGSIFPTTLSGRRWMWLQDKPRWTRLELAFDTLGDWADRLHRHTLGGSVTLFWAFLGLCLLGGLACVRERRPRLGTLAGWACVHLSVYLAVMPTIGHGGRYQPLVPGLFLPLAWLGADATVQAALSRASSPAPPRLAGLLRGVVAVVPAFLVVPVLDAWSRAERASVEHIAGTEIRMGELVRALPPDARVASFDIGGIGYFSHRSVVDLGGLADAGPLARLTRGQAAAYLAEAKLDYVVVPVGYGLDFPDPWNFFLRLGLDLTPLAREAPVARVFTPAATWAEGLRKTGHCAPGQLLYRVPPGSP